MSETATDYDRVKEALGSPVLASFSEELRLTKRNLLAVSAVVFFAQVSGMKIAHGGLSLVGLSFSNPGQWWLDIMLSGLVFYLLIQFLWQVADYLVYSRIRLTGSRVSWVTTAILADSELDYPSDPQQSSLYHWWKEQSPRIGNLRVPANHVTAAAEALERVILNVQGENVRDVAKLTGPVDELRRVSSSLLSRIDALEKTVGSNRIIVSLERFDRWFWCFSRSQAIRIWILDIIFPVVLALAALASALCSLFSNAS